jgi:hypothetical protein
MCLTGNARGARTSFTRIALFASLANTRSHRIVAAPNMAAPAWLAMCMFSRININPTLR